MKLIAEIGQAHDGSLGNLLSMVRKLCSLRVDIVKLQHHIADALAHERTPFRYSIVFGSMHSSNLPSLKSRP